MSDTNDPNETGSWANDAIIKALASPTNAYWLATKQLTAKASQANVEAMLKEANASWPDFVELTPDITQLLKANPKLSLHGAYMKAREMHGLPMNAPLLPSGKGMIFNIPLNYTTKKKLSLKEVTQGYGNSTNSIPASLATTWGGDVPYSFESLKPPPLWNLNEGLKTVRLLQAPSKSYGFHVCMGGGVVNKGASDKDLDLYFLPMGDSSKCRPTQLVGMLTELWGKPEIIGSAEYPEQALPYIAKLKFLLLDLSPAKRIDVFLMGAETFDVKECLKALEQFADIDIEVTRVVHHGRSGV